MKTPSILLLILLNSLLSAAWPADTWAQGVSVPPDARVVYLSSQRLTAESAAGRAGVAKIQAFQAERSAQVRARQQALETTRQQLAAAPTADERSRLALQEGVQRADSERASAQMQVDLQTLQREVSAELRAKVVAVLSEILKGTKVEMVMNLETAVVWANPQFDITAAVIERLNAPGPLRP